MWNNFYITHVHNRSETRSQARTWCNRFWLLNHATTIDTQYTNIKSISYSNTNHKSNILESQSHIVLLMSHSHPLWYTLQILHIMNIILSFRGSDFLAYTYLPTMSPLHSLHRRPLHLTSNFNNVSTGKWFETWNNKSNQTRMKNEWKTKRVTTYRSYNVCVYAPLLYNMICNSLLFIVYRSHCLEDQWVLFILFRT